MVCKENVVSWFGNLSSYKRIDVMCTLLNMCLPFEVRYLGTCVEDLGKRDYNVLRDTEHRANSVTDLAELKPNMISDKRTRRKLALYMALLHSCNYSCAVILYQNLSSLDFQEMSGLLTGSANSSSDDQPLEELLLLYTMALNHPAFNYEQKSTFGNIFLKLQEEEARLSAPKNPSEPMPFKSATQSCIPCVNQNDRMDLEISTNCVVAPPPMQGFQGELPMRGNAMIQAGVPPNLGIPPPAGLCIPSPEQMAHHPQYVHLGFPVNHMPPWAAAGQVIMDPNQMNQFVYHQADVLPYTTTSPLVSRQTSPSQSQSHSRSNSPINIAPAIVQQQQPQQQQPPRTSGQQATSTTTMTASTSTSSSQTTNITNSQAALPGVAMPHQPALPPINASRSLPAQVPPQQQQLPSLRPLAPMSNVYTRHGNNDPSTTTTTTTTATATAPKQHQQPPPPRLKPSLSGESLREIAGNKEMPNFKGNFQNYSNNEIRRLSDEDISKTDMTSNVLNNIKSQAANGLNQTMEKKIDGPANSLHAIIEPAESEMLPPMENNDNINKPPMTISDQGVMSYHQNHSAMTNMRRYPPPLDQPTHIQMIPAPPSLYHAPNACYRCLATTVPMAGIQNRFSRSNGPPFYCMTQLQSLRLEPDNSRHSHSSSSDSSGSRSPPETPPAAPWGGGNEALPVTSEHQHQQHMLHSIPTTHPHTQMNQPQPPQPQQQQQQQQERQRARKSSNNNNNSSNNNNNAHSQQLRHKNSNSGGMMNGGPPPPPTSLQPCTFPPGHTPMTYLPTHHFPTLRPTHGIYSYAYARPAPAGYPTLAAYQPNGEMYQSYNPGHHPHPPAPPGNSSSSGSSNSGNGTPPPVPVNIPITQQQQQQQPPPPPPQPQQSYPPVSAQPVIAYVPPPNLSCYNCGSNSHTAIDCKEQTMEDITRGAQYRLDYATVKSSGPEQNQSQASDK